MATHARARAATDARDGDGLARWSSRSRPSSSLYALQALYSKDFDTALEQIVFFLIPFALLFALLREVRWTRELVLGCVGVLVVLALVFCAIGFWEYDRRELFWNPKVIAANQFESYFRVNSVFWDPNVYGRFLALVMLAVTALMLWSTRGRASRSARRPCSRSCGAGWC